MDLRANTAVDVLIGPFLDSTDGDTEENGLTIEDEHVLLSKNGQALAAKNDASDAANDASAMYNCPLNATDLNEEGTLVLAVHMSGALYVRMEYNVLSEAAWDSLYAPKDAGFMDVNIKTIGRSDTQETEANNLEAACAAYSATRGLAGTAIPAVIAGAALGIPLKDSNSFLAVANIPAVAAGAAGGLFIAGSNAATTYSSLTVTNDVIFDTLTVTNETTFDGSVTMGSTFFVTGATTFNSTFVVTGATTFNSTFVVTGATTFASTFDIDGAVTLGSSLFISDSVTFDSHFSISGTTTFSAIVGLGQKILSPGGYSGSWDIDDFLTFYANTHHPVTGVATDAAAPPDYRIYEDESDTAIETGTMTVNADANTVGFYRERIQLLTATGYEQGKSYTIYIDATVDSITSSTSHTFQIGAVSNAKYIDSDKPAAANLKLQYNGTGLTGDNFPATQEQMGNISTGSAAINTIATSGSYVSVGSETLTYAATGELDETYHEVDPVGNTVEMFYEFNIGANAAPVSALWHGYVNTINDDVEVYAAGWSSTVAGAGTVTATNASEDVTGAGTDFQTDYDVGDQIFIDGLSYTVTEEPASATALKIEPVFAGVTAAGKAYSKIPWQQIGSIDGTSSSARVEKTFNFTSGQVGTGASTGLVRLRFTSPGDGNIITVLATDQVICGFTTTSQSVGYANGAIWINTNVSNENTTPFVDGVADNPVSTLAAAITLSGSVGLNRFEVAQGSSIQFVSTMDDYDIRGLDYTIDFNGQQMSNGAITGAIVGGIVTGNGGSILLEDCKIGNVTIPNDTALIHCAWAGTITLSEAGTYTFEDCFSVVAGSDTPCLDAGAAVGSTDINNRHYSGGLEIENFGKVGTDTMSIEGWGQIVVNANCDGGTIAVRGNFPRSGDAAAIAAITWLEDARIDLAQILTAITSDDVQIAGAQLNAHSAITPASQGELSDHDDNLALVEIDLMTLTDDQTQPGVGAPPLVLAMVSQINYMYTEWRNAVDQNDSLQRVYADNSSTVLWQSIVGEAGGLVTIAKKTSG